MEQFRCGDVHLGCDAVFSAETPAIILRQVTRHSWECHELDWPHLSAPVVRAVLAAIWGSEPEPTPPGARSVVLPAPRVVDVAAAEQVSRGPRSVA